ncbi:hypothetical protein DSL72_003754 [Monilinia vaccinii-corymbosi]|uniref:Uncharacterized protein n=1 Tax=Monilinia vaccinii-corymbosi TaxID=61207 RepID=A0A8A3NXM6_9HELO|nr:hypothetical protein DSL72_003754 [Monilinia vaccinii-corymbosi]
MAPRSRPSRRPSLARHSSQLRHSNAYAVFGGAPTRRSNLTEQSSEERNAIANITERKSSITTVASTFGENSSQNARPKVSTWASAGSTSISGTTIDESSEPSRAEKAAHKKALKKARKENPNVDSNFVYLPKGLNNRIKNRDPFRSQLRRLFKAKKKCIHKPLDRSQPASIPKLRYKSDHLEPAPMRFAPQIAPARGLNKRVGQDDMGSNFGGSFQAYKVETVEERAKRAKEIQLQHNLRKATDMKLRLEGREQINNPLIGRAPPIKSARVKAAVTPNIGEASPREVLLAEQAKPHLSHPRLHGSIQNSDKSLVKGTTPFTSEEILSSKKPLHSSLTKKPRRKLSVSFADSVEPFTIPNPDYGDSTIQELGDTGSDCELLKSDRIDPLVRGNLLGRQLRKRSEGSAIHIEDSFQESSIAEREEDASKVKQIQLQGELTALVTGRSDDIRETYHSRPENSKDVSSAKLSNDFNAAYSYEDKNLANQARQENSSNSSNPDTYDKITNFLLSSNTIAPQIPTKPSLQQISQKNLNSGSSIVNDKPPTLVTINPPTRSEVTNYLSELVKLIELHQERMVFLQKNKEHHRLQYGELQDPGARVKPCELLARVSRFFAEGGSKKKNPNDSQLARRERRWFTRDPKPAPPGQGGNTSGGEVGAGGDCREGDGQQRPFLESLSPRQRLYYKYNYVPPTPEARAAEAEELRSERLRKAEEVAALANEAVQAAYRAVLGDFDSLDAAAASFAPRSRGGIERDSTSDRANNRSHVTLGALSHEERGLGNSPAFTAAANSSTVRQRSQTSFGYSSPTSSLQVPQIKENRDTGGAARRLSTQSTAPQRTELKSISRRASSYNLPRGKQYSREEPSYWINSDTLFTEESDTDGVYRAYYQSSSSDKIPNKKTAINQKVESIQFPKSEAQVTPQLEKVQLPRAARRPILESQIIEASQPRPILTEEERPEPERRVALARLPRGPDPNPERTALVRRFFRSPQDNLKEDEALKAAAQRLEVSTTTAVNPVRETQASAAVNHTRQLQARVAANSARHLQVPVAANPARQSQILTTINPVRELTEPPVSNSAEVNRLRVARAQQHTRELQSNRNISSGSPVSRGAYTFGFDS